MTDSPEGPPRRVPRLALLLAAALLAALLCERFLLGVFVVEGASMEPTLRSGQRVLVWRRPGELERGDLVVFRNPLRPGEVLLKRVVGLPGEALRSDGVRLFVTTREGPEVELAEPYRRGPGSAFPITRLGTEEFFVLGDNRAESVDSRRFGEIDRRLILGKVVDTLW